MTTQSITVSYLEAKQQIEKQLDRYQVTDLCSILYKEHEFYFQLRLSGLDEKAFVDIIRLAKQHITNWRIHTCDAGLLSLQAMNYDLFDTQEILKLLKIRVSAIYEHSSIEFTKKAPLTEAEVSLITAISVHLLDKKDKSDPAFNLKQSGCEIFYPQDITISFENIGGYTHLKQEIQENIILPLQNQDIFDSVSSQTRFVHESNHPKAILFSGPPGVGKTTMAKIIAKEANVPLIHVPLERLMSAYYGESSKKLGYIFDSVFSLSVQHPFTIIFLDEIDSLALTRNEQTFEATRRILSVLLRKIDGIDSHNNYVTIGATNRRQDIDPALLSRFEHTLEFTNPSEEDRYYILDLYAKHLSLEDKKRLSAVLNNHSARAIKDTCKKAERQHARLLIESGSHNITPPTIERYLQVCKIPRSIVTLEK